MKLFLGVADAVRLTVDPDHPKWWGKDSPVFMEEEVLAWLLARLLSLSFPLIPISARSPDRCVPRAAPAHSSPEPLPAAIRHAPKRMSRDPSASLHTKTLRASASQPMHTPRRKLVPPVQACSHPTRTCEGFRSSARRVPYGHQSRGFAAKPIAKGDHITQWLLKASPRARIPARAT